MLCTLQNAPSAQPHALFTPCRAPCALHPLLCTLHPAAHIVCQAPSAGHHAPSTPCAVHPAASTGRGDAGDESPAQGPSQGCGTLIIAGGQGVGRRARGGGAGIPPPHPDPLRFPQGQEDPGRRRDAGAGCGGGRRLPDPLLGTESRSTAAAGPALVLKRRRCQAPALTAHHAVQRDPRRQQPRAEP